MLGPIARRTSTTLAATLVAACGFAGAATAEELPPPVDQIADLSTSSLACEPTNGASTRLGDDLTCRLSVRTGNEYGYGVTAAVQVPAGTSYDTSLAVNLAGALDTSVSPARVRYPVTRLGLMVPGMEKTVTLQLRLDPSGGLQPGDQVAPVATVHADNGPDVTVTAAPLTVMTTPADLTPSSLACLDLNADPLRPGDVLECTGHLENLPAKEDAVDVTAHVGIPIGTAWEPGGNETSHDASSIAWSALPGGVPSGDPDVPVLRFRLKVLPQTWPGTLISPWLNVFYVNAQSGVPGTVARSANALKSAPGPAALTSSLLSCSDLDGAPLLPGNTVSCALTAAASPGREDVADLTGRVAVPASTTAVAATLDSEGAVVLDSGLGSLPAGGAKTVLFRLKVDGDAAAGTKVAPTARLRGRSVGTDAAVAHDVTATPLVVSELPSGPAPPAVPVAAASVNGTPGATGGKTPVKTPAKPTPSKSSRKCLSKRTVTVTVWPPKGKRWKSVTAKYGSRSAKGKRWGRRRAYRIKLTFTGMPKGTMKVRISGKTTAGKTVKSTRSFRLCLPKL